jgi:hypothetical protein
MARSERQQARLPLSEFMRNIGPPQIRRLLLAGTNRDVFRSR